jgi:hydroxyacylglutathione hydrolase
VVPFGTPVILFSDTAVHEDAVRQLIRIGYDELPGYLDGGMEAWRAAGLPVARTDVLTMRELRERLEHDDRLIVLDVRQPHEWRTGHIPQAVCREAGDLAHAEPDLPRDRQLAAHCSHGQRAATALSLLERRGYGQLALVTGGIDDWQQAGGAVEHPKPAVWT